MSAKVKSELADLFGVNTSSVTVERTSSHIIATVDLYSWNHDGNAKPFTLKQMMALPAILGTEHIDFGHEAGVEGRTAESGSWGHYDKLVITARIEP